MGDHHLECPASLARMSGQVLHPASFPPQAARGVVAPRELMGEGRVGHRARLVVKWMAFSAPVPAGGRQQGAMALRAWAVLPDRCPALPDSRRLRPRPHPIHL